ncbi:MAG: hypothetical protein EXR73_00725 [Myxococcales bacterium]|nr:hypothetical protein [Myxococcales bacterium]
MQSRTERRGRRSTDVLVALRYQLETCREEAELLALVISDEHGICLASAGAADTCEEMAARLPMLARRGEHTSNMPLGFEGSELPVALRRFEHEGSPLYVCAVGDAADQAGVQLERSLRGVTRILAG